MKAWQSKIQCERSCDLSSQPASTDGGAGVHRGASLGRFTAASPPGSRSIGGAIERNSSVLCGLRFSLSDLESKIQGTSLPMKTPRSYLYSHNLMGSKPCLEVVTIISNSPLGCGRITYRDSAKPFSQQDLCLLLQDITVMVLSFQTDLASHNSPLRTVGLPRLHLSRKHQVAKVWGLG